MLFKNIYRLLVKICPNSEFNSQNGGLINSVQKGETNFGSTRNFICLQIAKSQILLSHMLFGRTFKWIKQGEAKQPYLKLGRQWHNVLISLCMIVCVLKT